MCRWRRAIRNAPLRGFPSGGRRQTACKPGSVPRKPGGWPFIWDSRRRLPRATHPDGGAETRLDAPAVNGGCPRRPYSVLLPVRLAVPRPLPAARCALTAPFHPCPARCRAVCFLWRCLGGRPRRALPGTVFPWSPDFPHPAGFPRWPGAAIRPSGPVKIVTGRAAVKMSGPTPRRRQLQPARRFPYRSSR